MEDQENAVPAEIVHHGSRKLKKPPPVTPKRFTRFFTPRSSITRVTKITPSKAGRQLREITQSGLNTRSTRERRSRSPRKSVVFKDINDLRNAGITTPILSSSKKRKAYLSPESLPFDSSPCKRACPEDHAEDYLPSSPPAFDILPIIPDRSPTPELRIPPRPIRRVGFSNVSGATLERSFGGMQITGRRDRKKKCIYWQAHARDFYTRPDDVHQFSGTALPYCTASCNTNSLIAIGDETGSIRLVDTAREGRHGFPLTYLALQPHTNAVMDLVFSADDMMLATASGDQTSRIIDMETQKVKYIMHAHSTSIKQVRFQPSNNNVLATSSRDGDIHIWDLRCKGTETVICETARPGSRTQSHPLNTQYKAYNARAYNSILSAHAMPLFAHDDVPSSSRDAAKEPAASTATRHGIVSVTALAFLNSPGRSHLLLSGSEASTTIRLWDIRNRYSRRGPPTPLSTTMEPESHSKHRHFGITSLTLNERGSRIFALSRDNTVYAYSAAHLITGHASELEPGYASKHHRSILDGRKGLGPLYGLRHAKLHATTFYVKSAMRYAKDDKAEMLAVGSANGSPILFPTDESSFSAPDSVTAPISSGVHTLLFPPASSPLVSARPILQRSASSSFGLSARMKDTIPMYNVGTALVGGHGREVTDVSWTHDGDLVTLSDDHSARLWREGAAACEVRRGKDGNAMRAGWGWADVEETLDEDDWA